MSLLMFNSIVRPVFIFSSIVQQSKCIVGYALVGTLCRSCLPVLGMLDQSRHWLVQLSNCSIVQCYNGPMVRRIVGCISWSGV